MAVIKPQVLMVGPQLFGAVLETIDRFGTDPVIIIKRSDMWKLIGYSDYSPVPLGHDGSLKSSRPIDHL